MMILSPRIKRNIGLKPSLQITLFPYDLKNYFHHMKIIFLLALFSIFSCSKESVYTYSTMKWQVGTYNYSVSKNIQSNNAKLNLNLSTSSYCNNSGIQVTILSNQKEIYNELISKFPIDLNLSIAQNSEVEIITSAISSINNIDCIWLGIVDCTLKY